MNIELHPADNKSRCDLTRFMAAMFVTFCLAFGTIANLSELAHAQSSSETSQSATVPGGTLGTNSDSDFWRQLKSGGQGTVAGQDKKSSRLIQVQGDSWRHIRNGPLPMYASWALLGIVGLLCLFYAARGRIRIGAGPSGQTVERFNMIERSGHWLLAISFIILALTGLNITFGKELLMPLIGKSAFASLTLGGKYIHNYVAFAFIIGLAMVTVMWIVHNLPSRHDVIWFLKGGGIIGSAHPPAKKFNAGQKIIFWVVVLCGISISLSGWALMFPFQTTMFADTFALLNSTIGTEWPTALTAIQEQQYASIWHAIMAVFMIVVIIAHIYIGTVGMEGALDAMTSGEVDRNWAKEHHSLWVEELDAKAADAPSKAAPQAAE